MTFLPIAARELRVASRRKRTYWMRFGAALGIIAFGLFLLFVSKGLQPSGLGGQLGFSALAFMLAQSCFALSGNAAECVSEEKREGTLGFLFLTSLKGHDVALGKLLSTSLTSFYCLLGAFPVVAIFLLLGGVSPAEFAKVVLALLNLFFVTHSAALLVSTLARQRLTVSLLFVAMMSWMIASLLFVHPLRAFHFDRVANLLLVLSPFYCLYAACLPDLAGALGLPMAGGLPGFPTTYYWISLPAVHLLAWIFFGAACWWLPRCWQETARPLRLRWRDRFQQWQYGSPATRTARRQALISINPFLWLISRNRFTAFAPWTAPLIAAILFALAFFGGPGPEMAPGIFFFCHLFLLLGVGSCVNSQLGEQRRSGSLQLLLCATPLTAPEILRAQWLALRRFFCVPLLAVLALDFSLIVWTACAERDHEDARAMIAFIALAMVLLVIDMVAAGWVAMWRSMLETPRPRSPIETLGLLVFVPAALLAAMLAFLSFYIRPWLDSFWFVMTLWFATFLAAAVLFSLIARRQLHTRFRLLLSAHRPA